MSHSLIVLPDDTSEPIVDAINQARRELLVRMFVFADATLLEAVGAAARRGVRVRMMLNGARRDGRVENDKARTALAAVGVEVRDGNPAFDISHEKSMVIDGEKGFVQSLNWSPKELTETRDYIVVTTHAADVAEMMRAFEADWNRAPFTPEPDSALVWCPNNGRQRIASFIDAVKEELWVQNERFQDMVIVERLVRAVRRGVKVRVLTREPHTLKADKLVEGVGALRILDDVGAKVHTSKHIKLHAKALLGDRKRAIVGSINLAPGSFDSRRELAIETDHHHVVSRLLEVVAHDWDHSHPLDLSDAGLVDDLSQTEGLGTDKLALERRQAKD
jgi:cardiolipin synthase